MRITMSRTRKRPTSAMMRARKLMLPVDEKMLAPLAPFESATSSHYHLKGET
jgi:hypothetical protein